MLDVRGLNCPMPVLAVQREVKEKTPKSLEVLADHMTAVYNIQRFAASQGYTVKVEETADGDYRLTLSK
ncbi:MAG: sulfurtransferase TusA family protein [Clostridia bacterium]|nr:sulfurtransferase TusA family protein [Clostridia bacterium]